MKTYLLSLSVILTTLSLSAQQVTNLNDSGPGSLRQAIFNASAGDTITIAPSLIANGNDTIHLTSELIVNKGLAIVGPNTSAGNTLYIDANSSHRHMYVDLGASSLKSLSLEGLAFTRGYVVDDDGSSILLLGVDTLRMDFCTLEKNYVGYSSGVVQGACLFGDLEAAFISNCTIRDNQSDTLSSYKSGIMILSSFNEIRNCIFENNIAQFGVSSAIFVQGETTVLDCVFRDNRSTHPYAWGTLAINGALGRVERCLFEQNDLAIGFLTTSSTPRKSIIVDCYFKNNYGILDGAIVSFTNSKDVLIQGCTFNESPQIHGHAVSFSGSTSTGRIETSTFVNSGSSIANGLVLCNSDSALVTASTFTSLNASTIFNRNISGASYVRVDNSILDYVSRASSNNLSFTSLGYNTFSSNYGAANSFDLVNISDTALDLNPLTNNGGFAPTLLPSPGSVVRESGNPSMFTPAQNGPVFGIREIGAAETQVVIYDTTNACGTISWWGSIYSQEGTYSDTAFNANSIDSVGVLVLSAQDTGVYDLDGTLYSAETDTNTSYQWVDCANNFAPINGATSLNFLPPTNGQYAVILTNQNCVDTSGCYDYNRFSVKEHSSTSSSWLRFYPNPTEGRLNIETSWVKVEEVRVFDLSGREVLQMNISGDALDLSKLRSGIYLVRWFGNNGEVQTDRLVIE